MLKFNIDMTFNDILNKINNILKFFIPIYRHAIRIIKQTIKNVLLTIIYAHMDIKILMYLDN